jgi:Thymidylate kinase
MTSIASELLPLDGLGRRRLKLAFVGTHGVGKTTLCYDLAAQLKRLDLGVELVKEVARRCPLPINEDTTLDAQAWILHTQIAEELEAAARYEAVICDRSVLDNYAYLVHRVGRRPDLDALVGSWIGGYHALFKVPVMSAPSFDGMRAVSRTFQLEIDATIDRLLGEFCVPIVNLDPAAREGWLGIVMGALGLPKHPPQMEMFSGENRETPG